MASTCFASATTPGGSRLARCHDAPHPEVARALTRRRLARLGAAGTSPLALRNDENAVRRGLRNVLGFFKERAWRWRIKTGGHLEDRRIESRRGARRRRRRRSRRRLRDGPSRRPPPRRCGRSICLCSCASRWAPWTRGRRETGQDLVDARVRVGDRDEGVYPSREARRRGAAGFSASGSEESPSSSSPPGYWIADEPGSSSSRSPPTTPVRARGRRASRPAWCTSTRRSRRWIRRPGS